ncbi:site-specific integrase [Streptomyces sp. 24-1644]|uniref:site-specific integrase n=1 Tax=Streptomyces sp. 24-1644 TaxID=3457315 RepID=UPI003FA7B3C8
MTTMVLTDSRPDAPPFRPLAGGEAEKLFRRFPARPRPTTWPETAVSRGALLDRLQQPAPILPGTDSTQATRMVGVRLLLRWLATLPGDTWQQRWLASPAATELRQWYAHVQEYARTLGRNPTAATIQAGMHVLICADAIRPDLEWLVANCSRFLRPAIQHVRDAEGFARLEAVGCPAGSSARTASEALRAIAQIMVAHGGTIQDIIVGDCLALLQATVGRSSADTRSARLAYAWLREMGQFPPDAPVTLLSLAQRSGQVSPEQLVDRYQLKCKPVRDVIVDYLTERRPSLDYSSIRHLSSALAGLFWADIEKHHPDADSLRLSAEVSTAWKARLATKTVRRKQPDGTTDWVTAPRATAPAIKQLVRAFYLDIAHWALEEPERWGPWVAPVPITEEECSVKKLEQQQKSRSDQRTRERLPVLPTLVRVAERRLQEARTRLDALNATPLGSTFTVLGAIFTVPKKTARLDGRPVTALDAQGNRRELGTEEKRAFWTWATIEILRHTGIRIEELREIGHHSIISYRIPDTDHVIPLLQIAPSKNDQERLLLVTPELADVLSTVISRVRSKDGTVPLIYSYDAHERSWNPPMPLLYQWNVSGENRRVSEHTLRDALNETLAASGLTDAAGRPLRFGHQDMDRPRPAGPLVFGISKGDVDFWVRFHRLSGSPFRRVRRTTVIREGRPLQHSQGTHESVYVLPDEHVQRASRSVFEQGAVEALKQAQAAVFSGHLTEGPEPAHEETVTADCSDQENSPWPSPEGGCGADFLLCLGCPNAYIHPGHHPRLAHLHQQVESLRTALDDRTWNERWSDHLLRLEDLRGKVGPTAWSAALARLTDNDRSLVQLLVKGDLAP